MTNTLPECAHVSIVTVNFNTRDLLRKWIANIRKTQYSNFEIIVIDNNSTDGSVEMIQKEFDDVKLIVSNENLGYAGGFNLAMKAASGEWLFILDSDAFPAPECISKMMNVTKNEKKIAVIGPTTFKGFTNKLDSAGGYITYPSGFSPLRKTLKTIRDTVCSSEEMAYVCGAAFLIKADVMKLLGGFDPNYFCYFEETDLCWRARMMGYKVVFCPNAVAHHLVGVTRAKTMSNPEYVYLMQRNRITTCMKNSGLTYFFVFLFAETTQAIALLVAGIIATRARRFILAYLRAACWNLRRFSQVYKRRMKIQVARKVSDREVLKIHIRSPFLLYLFKLRRKIR